MLSSLDLKSREPNWSTFQNTSIDGAFRLEGILGTDATSASFKAQAVDSPAANAVIRLYITEDARAAETQLALWQQAKELSHPNLLQILGCGRVSGTDDSLIYVALEPIDERLESVLQDR